MSLIIKSSFAENQNSVFILKGNKLNTHGPSALNNELDRSGIN